MATCQLCNSNEQNEAAYGELLRKGQTVVHEFCLYLSSGLVQNGNEDDPLYGFLPQDIRKEASRVKDLYCYICHKPYANIGCCETKCRKTFHMICGLKKGCENEFTETFRSYCSRHTSKTKRLRPPADETCCICFDTLIKPDREFYYAEFIRAPCCRNGWFHRDCLQGFARSSGYFFKCPLCNDTNKFRERVPYLGIFIRNADASWELEPNAFAELMQRPNKCEAEICRNRRGRTNTESERDPLLCCEICGARGSHKLCLPEGNDTFICSDCTQFATLRPSVSEGDSGQESIQAEDVEDEDVEVDVCILSDSDDDDVIMKSQSRKIFSDSNDDDDNDDDDNEDDDNDDDDVIVQSHSRKKTNQIIDSSDNEMDQDSENVFPKDTTSKLGAQSNECETTSNLDNTNNGKGKEQGFSYESTDEESDLELASCHIPSDKKQSISIETSQRKRKITDLSDNSKDHCIPSKKNNDDSFDLDEDADPLDFFDILIKKNQKEEIKSQFGTKLSQNHENILRNVSESDDFAEKENSRQILEPDISQPDKYVDIKRNISCIANRTRHRQKYKAKTNTADTKRSHDYGGSSTYSPDADKKKRDCLSNISCIAKRTRRSKSIYYPENNLSAITEETSSDSYRTSCSNVISNRKCSNGPSHSRDDGFSSDSQSSFATVYGSPENRLNMKNARKKHLRCISLKSDEEFEENNEIKNR